jgi:2Fe-2S ferredoxin
MVRRVRRGIITWGDMPTIVFIEPGGQRREITVQAGISLMEAARSHGIPGILALCGGACACATCHVYLDATRAHGLPPPEDMELGMLEGVALPQANSRLGCQVIVTAAMDGLEVTIPAQQAAG